MPSAALGAREAVVNSLSPLRIDSLVVKAHMFQRTLQALVKMLEFGCRALTSFASAGDPSLCHGEGSYPKSAPHWRVSSLGAP